MPEGPEVKTIVKELNDTIKDKTLIDIEFDKAASKLSAPLANEELKQKLINKKVIAVNRIGKYIDIVFEQNLHLILHLLITGRLSYYDKNSKQLPKYSKAAFKFDDGSRLCLGDKRSWTKLKVMTSEEVDSHKNFTDLGVDVFSNDYTLETFTEKIKLKKPIYVILMDQKIISGLGNIYVNEILFRARVNPKRHGANLNNNHIKDIYQISKELMELAYAEKGTTVKSFMERTPSSVGWHTLDGSEGGFYKYLKIFDKKGQSCPTCSAIIEKEELGGRNAFYCPNCQPISDQQQLCF